ncbi:MAG TPA: hypothetical protein VGK89_01490 [Candidatus Eisenbacteria bacterium]|jgi:hypothetical protein
MPELNRIVAHALNGKLIKGTTQDFSPNRPLFHIQLADGSENAEVRSRNIKAVFFVKEFDGDHTRHDIKGFMSGPGETAHGKKIAVRFKDGELLCGYSLTYSQEREGFFMFPADPKSNNIRIYVMVAATVEVKAGPAAEALLQKQLDERKGGDAAA